MGQMNALSQHIDNNPHMTEEAAVLSFIRDRDAVTDPLAKHVVPEDEPIGIDPITDDAPIIGSMHDVATQILEVKQNDEDIRQFKEQADQAAQFYKNRIDALERRSDMLKENCGRWLKLNGLKNLATHAGTILFTKRTKVTMPPDDVLLTFIKTEDPDNTLGLIRESPNKTDLKQYIASSGKKPEGYLEEKVEGISIRKVA